MFIDSHYHFMAGMNEKAAAGMVGMIVHEARKMGMNPDYETMLKTAVQTWGDPLGDRLIEKMDEGGIDVTVAVNVDDFNIKQLTWEKMQAQNRILGEAVQRHPGRIISLAGIDPRSRKRRIWPESAWKSMDCGASNITLITDLIRGGRNHTRCLRFWPKIKEFFFAILLPSCPRGDANLPIP